MASSLLIRGIPSYLRKPWVAGVLALVFAVMLYFYLAQLESTGEGVVARVAVLVEDVAAGTTITGDHILLETRPVAQLPLGWIDGLVVAGMITATDLSAGSVLTRDHLEFAAHEDDQREGDSSGLPGGKHFVVSVPTRQARHLQRGQLVDIIGIFPARIDASEQSVVIASQVEVVDVLGSDYGEGVPLSYPGLSETTQLVLSVDDVTVHRLALADAFGQLRVVSLGSAADSLAGRVTSAITLESLLQLDGTPAVPSQKEEARRGGRHDITVIRGSQVFVVETD